MVDRISGMKVLLLDEETIGTLSLLSQCNSSLVTVTYSLRSFKHRALLSTERKFRENVAVPIRLPSRKNASMGTDQCMSVCLCARPSHNLDEEQRDQLFTPLH